MSTNLSVDRCADDMAGQRYAIDPVIVSSVEANPIRARLGGSRSSAGDERGRHRQCPRCMIEPPHPVCGSGDPIVHRSCPDAGSQPFGEPQRSTSPSPGVRVDGLTPTVAGRREGPRANVVGLPNDVEFALAEPFALVSRVIAAPTVIPSCSVRCPATTR
jgi:hypothetical protein